ncbi:unnamed protein product [Cyclocybe aegerita]|uniref:Uncharacterized protein n=1 Tax=Cyclocybe aegerita TaxID=1973307 RepID=A0A8S0WW79_CYCAE|nr:unnamed protein product [Cyclocybe aegerita]
MASELSIIVDDDSGDFTYSGGEWTLSTLVQWYKGTSWWPAFAGNGVDFGTFTFNFEGSSVAFIGNTPVRQLSQSALVSIDGGAPTNISYGDNSPPSYMQWYQSPTLSDGRHTITVSRIGSTSVDFAVVKVGRNTALSGKTVIVDDDNSAISYSSNWRRTPSRFDAGTLPDGYPYGGSTHRGSTVGDTITFRFTGTSASLYGLFNWANIGVLAASYTLDGSTDAQTYSVTSSSPQYVKNDAEASNFLLFSRDNLTAGDHTLVITITRCDNQDFMLDYITYAPSFSTLASMPNLPVGPVTNPDPTTSDGSTGSTSAAPAGITTVVTGTSGVPITTVSTPIDISSGAPSPSISSGSTSSGTQLGNQGTASESNSTPIGAIIGGVIGGLGVLVLAVFLFFWLRRRKAHDNEYGVAPNASLINSGSECANGSYPSSGHMQEHLSPNRPTFVNSPVSSGTISPFQETPPANHGFGSVQASKRERLETVQRNASSPSSGPSGDMTPTDATQRSMSPEARVTSWQVAPPSYEAVSPQPPTVAVKS